ncbi:ring-1,2-phenylacetyl-CoA epoxidase subunit PaaC [Actinopolyspora biskrensis]|uniref:Ring-1,2-phenylacetyl-CoA epoxidase subunit PaaC n=1 Tax=Actinopolyspora biskrensis TaxID=1470178 RepID=A0A852YX59_9ACTN|nr:1,2-phenylacetyl-CoA epoxidase subunit PaaC [Actinopolyspora biskrensis]NYH78668.1 ring-1,2-phenylacetyl-CoA epoxidase subunit PaaC [Actinopolyspora biskrensis]
MNSSGFGGEAEQLPRQQERIPDDRSSPGWEVRPAANNPLAGVDRGVPGDVSLADLSAYCLMLGDDALVLSWRLAQWCHRGPDLEEDQEQVRILLELLGHARELLGRAAAVEGGARDENAFARSRGSEQFRNVRLTELDCGPGAGGDFAASVARLLVCAAWRSALLRRLMDSRDPVLAGVAGMAWPETRGHRDHAAQWVIRLGDGTAGSRERMRAGLARVWPMTRELFAVHPVERRLADAGYAVDPAGLRAEVSNLVDEVLSVARLDFPDPRVFSEQDEPNGRSGAHTAALDFLLAETRSEADLDVVPGGR